MNASETTTREGGASPSPSDASAERGQTSPEARREPATDEERSGLAEQLTSSVASALSSASRPVLLHAPSLEGTRAAEYAAQCIETNWISSAGAFVNRFEEQLGELTGAHAVAVVNGTCALQLALQLAGVEPGDEVLVPALTFVATANAVQHAAAQPHFVDAEPTTLGIDPEALEQHLQDVAEQRGGACWNRHTGRRIRALVPVHVFGLPCQITALAELAERWQLELVEDAAEALGSTLEGRHCGTFGRLGTLSFNGNKIVSTGGGGAILTRDPELAQRAKHLSTTAKRAHAWEFHHDAVAYNYRMPNLNAAIGCAQLEVFGELLERKRRLTQRYAHALAPLEGISLVREPTEGATWNHWLNTLLLQETSAVRRDTVQPDTARRDRLLSQLNEAGLQCRPIWQPLHQLPMYREQPRAELPQTEALYLRVINLPSSSFLAPAEGASIPGDT